MPLTFLYFPSYEFHDTGSGQSRDSQAKSTLSCTDGPGLYHRFSPNCRAIFFRASLIFGSKVEFNQCFNEIILATVSGVWAVHWRSPRKSPIIRQWLHYISMKTSDCFPISLTQYANSSSSSCWDPHFMCFNFKLFQVSLPTRLHNAHKLTNTPPKK